MDMYISIENFKGSKDIATEYTTPGQTNRLITSNYKVN